MKQVNIRFDDDEHAMLHALSTLAGKSIPALVKDATISGLRDKATILALELYKKGTIGLKTAWKLSGLSFFEFSRLILQHGIEPSIPDELDEKMIGIVRTIDVQRVFPGKTVDALRRLVYPDMTTR